VSDPWAFGWTQLLTIIGLIITIVIAIGGFRTFGRWKKEQLEGKRIEIAIEALSIAYESGPVFDHIRSIMASDYEWSDMPQKDGESEADRRGRGTFYATAKRIQDHRDFFERVARLQPRFMAMFGAKTSDIFLLLHRSRREIEVATQMLSWRVGEERHGRSGDQELYRQMEADIWTGVGDAAKTKEGDRVGRKLKEFQDGIEALCRPVIERGYGKVPRRGLMGGIVDGLESLRH
jgi:hypothetical protein